MKTKILNVLRKSDGYVSGQALCNMLGVSRTAVWKVINQLKEEGYVIEAVQNKGYHITQYPDILTSSEIMSQLTCVDTGNTTGIIREVVYYDETDSTNNEAKRAAERDNAADGTLYITESQTGGRGRRGRNWVSPAGSGIWMSLLLRPDIAPVNASMLTIVAAMAVQEAIHKVLTEDGHVAECRIKWPNDIVLNKKKVCGILTEMSAEMDYIHYVVIGMGINVNTTEFDDSIKATASSLYLETGDHLKRSRIVAAFSEIGFKNSQIGTDVVIQDSTSQQKLCANVAAQIVAFACGKADDDRNKNFEGGRPSSIIIGEELNPKTLGALLAHFENKVMFQGFLWNINSFDQEGVQLGKVLAKRVLAHDTDGALKVYSDLLNI